MYKNDEDRFLKLKAFRERTVKRKVLRANKDMALQYASLYNRYKKQEARLKKRISDLHQYKEMYNEIVSRLLEINKNCIALEPTERYGEIPQYQIEVYEPVPIMDPEEYAAVPMSMELHAQNLHWIKTDIIKRAIGNTTHFYLRTTKGDVFYQLTEDALRSIKYNDLVKRVSHMLAFEFIKKYANKRR